jgi:FlaA1/EpsC-like NDP-sugar epimerase
VVALRSRLVSVGLAVSDIVSLTAALVLAVCLRFEFAPEPSLYGYLFVPHYASLLAAIPLYLAIFSSFRLYRYAWRYASLEMVWNVVLANSVGVLGLWLLSILFFELPPLSRSVFPIFWLLGVAFVGGVRLLLRLLHAWISARLTDDAGNHPDAHPRRVIILGGGPDAARLISSMQEDSHHTYTIIGVLDDSPWERGSYIRGVPVIGPIAALQDVLAADAVDEVFIRLSAGNGREVRKYVMACRARQVPVKVIPPLVDLMNARVAQVTMENFSVEDLLRRPPVRTNMKEIGSYVTGKRVLVTGAGGSIGSELCRQLLALSPEALVLFGHGENSLHRIHQELCHRSPEWAARIFMVVGSVADDVRVVQAFSTYAPQVVFHAAAHKHVPMMEANVPEAVQNNVMGTRCVAEACGRAGVERMVLISTDKAVTPSSVMGATKWLCEEVVRLMAGVYPATTYVTVRFGNVLGSRGSVTTVFQDQIRRGGPVTVTHAEMTRYFMTIPEAVQLVLQAGAVGRSGALYLLDMGQPVRILDLATDMIRLSGLEPDEDIRVEFTGLRPGEKLHESLTTRDEDIKHASEGLFIVTKPAYFAGDALRDVLRHLQQQASTGDAAALLEYLGDVVPAFAGRGLLDDVITETPVAAGTQD